MGNILVVRGADFNKAKSRKVNAQKVAFEHVYEGAAFTQAGKIKTWDTTKTAADFPNIVNPTFDGTASWAIDFAISQVAIPDGAIAIGGISNVATYKTNQSAVYNGLPIGFADSGGSAITSAYGINWYTDNAKNAALEDDDFLENNTAESRPYNMLSIVSKVDGVAQQKASLLRKIQFVMNVPPNAAYANFTWMLPRSVTGLSNQYNGKSSLGAGLLLPEVYWLFS